VAELVRMNGKLKDIGAVLNIRSKGALSELATRGDALLREREAHEAEELANHVDRLAQRTTEEAG
jgi:hypothetical protein